MVGRALYYGFDGDFMSAVQRLTPQLEILVRVHLNDAGFVTTAVKDGIVNELHLSFLTAGRRPTRFSAKTSRFAVRALSCSSVGPNLRNEFAHGPFTARRNDLVAGATRSCWHATSCEWKRDCTGKHRRSRTETRCVGYEVVQTQGDLPDWGFGRSLCTQPGPIASCHFAP
jgi:hypothetical protein